MNKTWSGYGITKHGLQYKNENMAYGRNEMEHNSHC